MLHGYNPPSRYLPYLSWTEIADLPDKENTVIVLPTGSTEQHGPHLPCAVDTVISAGVVGHALAHRRLREENARALPYRKAPAWVFLHGLKSPLSSTALRNKAKP